MSDEYKAITVVIRINEGEMITPEYIEEAINHHLGTDGAVTVYEICHTVEEATK